MPSPAQWAAEGTEPASVGSTAEEEPVQRMQPASDLADRGSEGDSSAAAVEQHRCSSHSTATLPGCSDPAQPAALVQPDVCSLEDADTDLQARQGSYAEAEVSLLLKVVPECNAALRQARLCVHFVQHIAALQAPACFAWGLQLAGSWPHLC